MDGRHKCFGCRKPFDTQKRLHAHEARCKANKRFKADIISDQDRLSNKIPAPRRPNLDPTIGDDVHACASNSEPEREHVSVHNDDVFDIDDALVCEY